MIVNGENVPFAVLHARGGATAHNYSWSRIREIINQFSDHKIRVGHSSMGKCEIEQNELRRYFPSRW